MLSWIDLMSETLETSSLFDEHPLPKAGQKHALSFCLFVNEYLQVQLSLPSPRFFLLAYSLEIDGLPDDRFRPDAHWCVSFISTGLLSRDADIPVSDC